jgi:hypothetical protein
VQLAYLHSTDIHLTSVYNYRTRARNVWGWSEWSATIEIQPSTRPEIVYFDVYNNESTGTVDVVWYWPDWHNSVQSNGFTIEIDDNGTWVETN